MCCTETRSLDSLGERDQRGAGDALGDARDLGSPAVFDVVAVERATVLAVGEIGQAVLGVEGALTVLASHSWGFGVTQEQARTSSGSTTSVVAMMTKAVARRSVRFKRRSRGWPNLGKSRHGSAGSWR